MCQTVIGGQASRSHLLPCYPRAAPNKHTIRWRDRWGEARRPHSSASPACAQQRHHRLSTANQAPDFRAQTWAHCAGMDLSNSPFASQKVNMIDPHGSTISHGWGMEILSQPADPGDDARVDQRRASALVSAWLEKPHKINTALSMHQHATFEPLQDTSNQVYGPCRLLEPASRRSPGSPGSPAS